MRVTPRELRGIRAEGLVTRFAILGPVAFVSAEVPAEGSAATGLERPTDNPAWGIILNGEVALHGPLEQHFTRGTAFHVPAGPPAHWFSARGRAVIAGFAPMTRELDTSDAGMRALGFEPLPRLAAPEPPPAIIAPVGGGTTFRSRGAIDVESAQMGDWVFTRTSYGPLSGYTSGWCDLPHWGMVLNGDLALRFEDSMELLSTGDVYYCPAGPPGHQFQVADAATTIDYTPVADLFGPARKSEWRAAAARRLPKEAGVLSRTSGSGRTRARPTDRPRGEAPDAGLQLGAGPEPSRELPRADRRRRVQWVGRGLSIRHSDLHSG